MTVVTVTIFQITVLTAMLPALCISPLLLYISKSLCHNKRFKGLSFKSSIIMKTESGSS